MVRKKWADEELKSAIELFESGKNFKEIGNKIGKTQNSVTKKLNRLGIKYLDKRPSKYESFDWILIQEEYDKGKSYRDLQEEFSLTPQSIKWAKDNGKIKMRSNSEGKKLAWANGKHKASNKKGIERYRQLCEFKFGVKSFPKEFNLKLIQEHGWYQASNRGNNLNGVSRDHIISVKFGFENKIAPEIIAHPANCRLMRHINNQKKNIDCNMSLEDLKNKIKEWNKKY